MDVESAKTSVIQLHQLGLYVTTGHTTLIKCVFVQITMLDMIVAVVSMDIMEKNAKRRQL